MRTLFVCLLLLKLLLFSCTEEKPSIIVKLSTQRFSMGISEQGAVLDFTDVRSGQDYLAKDSGSALLSLRINGEVIPPRSATIEDDILRLTFDDNVQADIRIEEKDTHLTFELTSLSNHEDVDLILWGPYYTNIGKTIGETVGVVRDETFAVGIQSLNIKTLGGYPWNESDRMPAFDIFREENPDNMHPENDGSVLYRVEAAKPTASGSSLQAYCRNRRAARIVQDFNHDSIVAPPYEDGGVLGSRIAIFGCPEAEALATLGTIEVAEGLPHPMINSQWGKTAPEAAAAYIITNFTEDNVEEAIAITKKAGLKYMYHYGKTFENWGHFDLYEGEFPNGMAGLQACVEKAAAEGVMVGTHFLSNFITPNDPYVTPVPDPRLAKVGSSVITADIDPKATEIPIQSPEFFNQMKNNSLKTVMIGNELIRYGKVSEQAPWKLLDCQRGAFGTEVSAHPSGKEISKLLDHAYKVFLTDADLTVEMSERMAEIYNKTGLRQISFDGLEGNRSTGLGTYGESLMPYVWYNNLSDSLKDHLIIDASRTTHFFWHIYTRMNWGEPWYGGFRESQAEYRFNNQAYFKRNFMPGMLGWFKMTPETSLEDIEWLLARSAAYDAGYAFVANLEELDKNGNTEKILEFISKWEKLRISGSFTAAQKEMMRNAEKEFSLVQVNDNIWNLKVVSAKVLKHDKKVRQPGEPLYSTLEFDNSGNVQPLSFILSAVGCDISGVTFEINNYKKVTLPTDLKQGQILKYTGSKQATLYDANWHVLGEFPVDPADFEITEGANTINLDCSFDNASKEPFVRLEVRTQGEKMSVALKK
jgi:hypothetical protein